MQCEPTLNGSRRAICLVGPVGSLLFTRKSGSSPRECSSLSSRVCLCPLSKRFKENWLPLRYRKELELLYSVAGSGLRKWSCTGVVTKSVWFGEGCLRTGVANSRVGVVASQSTCECGIPEASMEDASVNGFTCDCSRHNFAAWPAVLRSSARMAKRQTIRAHLLFN